MDSSLNCPNITPLFINNYLGLLAIVEHKIILYLLKNLIGIMLWVELGFSPNHISKS